MRAVRTAKRFRVKFPSALPEMIRCSAIIVAAGSSRRMGFNKLLAPLSGEPVLRRTLGVFARCAEVGEIIVVAGDEVRAVIEHWRAHGGLDKLVQVVPGGAERHFSVKNGIDAVSADCEIIAVHDGARPLVSVSQVAACIVAAEKRGAVTCARRMTETLKRVDANGCVHDSIDREGAWIMETPQVFRRDLLERAYEAVLRDGVLVTDEVSAVQHLGEPVWVVENDGPNPKITLSGDIALAERLIA